MSKRKIIPSLGEVVDDDELDIAKASSMPLIEWSFTFTLVCLHLIQTQLANNSKGARFEEQLPSSSPAASMLSLSSYFTSNALFSR